MRRAAVAHETRLFDRNAATSFASYAAPDVLTERSTREDLRALPRAVARLL